MKYIFLLLIFSLQAFALEVPRLTSPVEDKANILNSTDKAEIVNILHGLNDRGLIQMNVLTIPSLEGEVLEEYSIKVAEKWKLGTEKKDNGLILLLAMQERKIRIEVGNGIEGEITDYLSSRIIERMKDFMRSGDYAGAIKVAIKNIQTAMEENLPENIAARAESNRIAALEYQRQEEERLVREEQLRVQNEKDEARMKENFNTFVPVGIIIVAVLVFGLSFNQKQIEHLKKSIMDGDAKSKDLKEKISLTRSVHSKMKVDHEKYKFVREKEEVSSLRSRKAKLISDIQSMKRYLGVG